MANNYIGLDVGKARVGFSLGNDSARIASALFSTPLNEAQGKVAELISEKDISGVVVGLPRNLEGDETGQTAWVRQWVAELKPKIKVPLYAQDEALTTKLAEARALGSKKPQDMDALAAAIILQDFLDSSEAERVIW